MLDFCILVCYCFTYLRHGAKRYYERSFHAAELLTGAPIAPRSVDQGIIDLAGRRQGPGGVRVLDHRCRRPRSL